MSTQVQTKAGTLKFLQFHQPGLSAGDYEISVNQLVNIDASEITFATKKNFTVAGERFELNPTNVLAVFPPDGNLGDHFHVLPHVILNRSTLPWERRAEKSATGIPWLALLLFDEDQKPKSQTMTLKKLLERSDGPKFPALTLENGQHDDDMVTVIDVPRSRLEAIMPSAEDLALLTHVRFGVNAQNQPKEEELAVIISNRLPQPGKISNAYLVSVESRFNVAGPNKYEFDYDHAAANDLIRLVSLKSWSFTCEDPKKNLKELLLGLNKSADAQSTLRLPRGTDAAERFFSRGYVPLPHSLRHGDETTSWFHGPLIPGKNTSPPINLPARCADELFRYDAALAMFDISYGAAWELGRRLALQDKAVSKSLYRWKRRRAQARAQTMQHVSHLPFQRSTSVVLPDDVTSWFMNLRKLKGVPFNYLVPDERMLPPESIRFFRLDRAWIDCLADGAFSIGRVSRSEEAADKIQGKTPAADTETIITGFLLRSEVVSGWPGLLVDAYSDHDGTHGIDSARIERLSAGVLLCLFEGEIVRVDIHQKPETLHFGFVWDAEIRGFYKKLRDPQTGDALETKVVLGPQDWRPNSQRTLEVTALCTDLKISKATSSQFAFQMVEGVDKVIFLARKPDSPT